MIEINFNVKKAGWAIGQIENEDDFIEFSVSYLHDSLKELAESAIEIGKKDRKSVLFMKEPGEHVLILNKKENNLINYELRWYRDWWSMNLIDENDFESILQGRTTVSEYVSQVRNVLDKIMIELGPEEYRKRWVEYDFPTAEFEKLKQLST